MYSKMVKNTLLEVFGKEKPSLWSQDLAIWIHLGCLNIDCLVNNSLYGFIIEKCIKQVFCVVAGGGGGGGGDLLGARR